MNKFQPRYDEAIREVTTFTKSEDRRQGLMPRRRNYPIMGVVFALGAPAGLLLSRCVGDGVFPSMAWIANTITSEALTYGYITLSAITFLPILGYLLGRKSDHLRALSGTDTLTGLFNRRIFDERLEDEMRRSTRYHIPLSIMSVDLDRLKGINDKLGHKAGDAALMAVARSLSGNARTIDIVARVGGDEFIVLFPQTTAVTAAKQAGRFAKALAHQRGTWARPLSASVGIAEFDPTIEASGAEFLLAADTALYKAKAGGGGKRSWRNLTRRF